MNCKYCHNSETIPMQSKDSLFVDSDELITLVKENMPFIRGVTVSGGEATIYYKFLTEFFKKVHELGLTAYIDTNGFFDVEKISELIDVTDKFLYDIKSDAANMQRLCFDGASSKLVDSSFNFKNLEYLLKLDKVEEVRLVYLKDYFDDEKLINDIADRMRDYEHVIFKIIRVHIKGLPKERVEGIKKNIPSTKRIRELEEMSRRAGIKNIVTIM